MAGPLVGPQEDLLPGGVESLRQPHQAPLVPLLRQLGAEPAHARHDPLVRFDLVVERLRAEKAQVKWDEGGEGVLK